MTNIINALEEVSGAYDVLLCDLWGCYHNGVTPYPAAVEALRAYRRRGGVVVLLTNAPRPNAPVQAHLDGMGGPRDSYDAIVSSGDATRAVLAERRFGAKTHIVGPERDSMIWDGLDLPQASVNEAELILCTGLFDDETETPDDYAELVAEGVSRGLPFLCANPDIVVDRGETRLWCAGAIARAYENAGGATHYFGKPHAPIYDLARRVAAPFVEGARTPRFLAVGDGVATDVLGAEQAGIDCIFVSGGLAAREVGDTPDNPDAARLADYLAAHGRKPAFTIGRLR